VQRACVDSDALRTRRDATRGTCRAARDTDREGSFRRERVTMGINVAIKRRFYLSRPLPRSLVDFQAALLPRRPKSANRSPVISSGKAKRHDRYRYRRFAKAYMKSTISLDHRSIVAFAESSRQKEKPREPSLRSSSSP